MHRTTENVAWNLDKCTLRIEIYTIKMLNSITLEIKKLKYFVCC